MYALISVIPTEEEVKEVWRKGSHESAPDVIETDKTRWADTLRTKNWLLVVNISGIVYVNWL